MPHRSAWRKATESRPRFAAIAVRVTTIALRVPISSRSRSTRDAANEKAAWSRVPIPARAKTSRASETSGVRPWAISSASTVEAPPM